MPDLSVGLVMTPETAGASPRNFGWPLPPLVLLESAADFEMASDGAPDRLFCITKGAAKPT
jgi:hypothetical protein